MFIPKRSVDEFQPYLLAPDGAPPVARRNICSGDVGKVITSAVETIAPIAAAAFFPPALPFVLGGEAALNAGEGIVGQKPFGDIALGLGESAAGAAVGGQFGDFLGGAGDFFGGGGAIDPLAATGDAAAASAAGQFGAVPAGDSLGGFGAGLTPTDLGINPAEAIGGQGGFNNVGDLLTNAFSQAETAGLPIGSAGGPTTTAESLATGQAVGSVQQGDFVSPAESLATGLPVNEPAGWTQGGGDVAAAAPTADPLAAFTAPPPVDTGAFTPSVPTAAPAAPAPDLTPVLTDTGVLGTSPVMEVPGMGVPAAPASADVAAPGAGTATPGSAAGTGGAVSGITPGQTLDPFGISGTASGAPGVGGLGGGDVGGIPVPDSSAGIPQGDLTGGLNSPGDVARTAGQGAAGVANDPLTQLAQAAPTGGGSPVSATDLGIDPSAAITGGGSGGFSDVGSLLASLGLDSGGGAATGASAIPPDMIDWANAQSPLGAITPGNPLGSGSIVPGTATSAPPTSPLGGIGDFIKSNGSWLGPLLGVAGLGKQLLAPGLSLTPGGGGANTAALTAAQQALIDQLAQLRQTTLTPAAQQGSTALTKATSTAQQYADQLLSGKLTPEQSQLVANNLAATISTIKSRYGSMGMGNSTAAMEDQAAAEAASVGGAGALQQQNTAQGIQLEQLASSDAQASVQELLTASGVEGNQTNTLLANQMAQDAQLSQMIARLAAALGSSPPTYTLQPTV
jgi:hypothetical protein